MLPIEKENDMKYDDLTQNEKQKLGDLLTGVHCLTRKAQEPISTDTPKACARPHHIRVEAARFMLREIANIILNWI